MAAVPTIVSAQETPGTPQELVGRYGNSPHQCQSYHRKYDDITVIDERAYTFCGGSGCEAEIVSHRKIDDGFVLKLRSRGNPEGWSQQFRIVDDQVVEVVSDDGRTETLVRCTLRDAIAGIGLSDAGPGALTASLEVIFSGHYVLAVRTVCPDLTVDERRAETLIEAGRRRWGEFLVERGLLRRPLELELSQTTTMSRASAEYAVREDFAEIPDFCEEVLDAFGAGGRVYPDLILDYRKKI